MVESLTSQYTNRGERSTPLSKSLRRRKRVAEDTQVATNPKPSMGTLGVAGAETEAP